MPATLIKGKPIAERIRAEVAEDVKKLGHIGLVTVLVGDDPASEVYIRLKHKAAVAVSTPMPGTSNALRALARA